MNGFILINKESGPTSHDIVREVRKIAGTKKVGHTGTLDPLASGLMAVCIGNATKAAEYITNGDKAYIAEMELGLISDTLDITGAKIEKLPEKTFSETEIRDAVMSFSGDIVQLPPMYSAKRIDGKKLYRLARKGIEIERKPINVTVKRLEILENEKKNKNFVKFYILCTKGTYIRSIIDDIGKKLNYGAVMTSLKRVMSGGFDMSTHRVYTVAELAEFSDITPLLYPVDRVFADCPKISVSPDIEALIRNGVAINLKRAEINLEYGNGQLVRVYNEKGDFFALMEPVENGCLKLKKSFF